MNAVLIELQYLPPISYFVLLRNFEEVFVEKFEHYQKQTYRNRCYINTSQGVETLILPVTAKHGKTLITDIKIDYGQKWLNNHWRTIQSAYGKAPFFEYYQQDLHDTLFKRQEFLYDLNLELLKMCLKWLRYNIVVRETSLYEKIPQTGVSDYRSAINPKKAEGCNRFFKSAEYQQVFGSKFVDNLSIIDLIFCEGPGAIRTLLASTVK